ncbi:MAG: cbb3-type cytochrome oxidase assembly protein CcoS [Colwelliaceae bacterium]|jgi:cbb3-type cytochrome oxidase maturation protein|nr:cbb3-type cytochrome oxidase assembly protein CcoS [Colwelliaceae bacterium]
MSIIYILIPIAILLTALGIYLFFWAVKTDQFDDLEKQGLSILFDDEKLDNSSTQTEQQSNEEESKKNN